MTDSENEDIPRQKDSDSDNEEPPNHNVSDSENEATHGGKDSDSDTEDHPNRHLSDSENEEALNHRASDSDNGEPPKDHSSDFENEESHKQPASDSESEELQKQPASDSESEELQKQPASDSESEDVSRHKQIESEDSDGEDRKEEAARSQGGSQGEAASSSSPLCRQGKSSCTAWFWSPSVSGSGAWDSQHRHFTEGLLELASTGSRFSGHWVQPVWSPPPVEPSVSWSSGCRDRCSPREMCCRWMWLRLHRRPFFGASMALPHWKCRGSQESPAAPFFRPSSSLQAPNALLVRGEHTGTNPEREAQLGEEGRQ